MSQQLDKLVALATAPGPSQGAALSSASKVLGLLVESAADQATASTAAAHQASCKTEVLTAKHHCHTLQQRWCSSGAAGTKEESCDRAMIYGKKSLQQSIHGRQGPDGSRLGSQSRLQLTVYTKVQVCLHPVFPENKPAKCASSAFAHPHLFGQAVHSWHCGNELSCLQQRH